jgi:hypothetical protein
VGDLAPHRHRLAADLLILFSRRLLRVLVAGPRSVPLAGPCPGATSVARWQATRTDGVTNRRHEQVHLNDLSRCLLAKLDGRHDRAALGVALREAMARGDVEIRRDGQRLSDADENTVVQLVGHALSNLAEMSLLVA